MSFLFFIIFTWHDINNKNIFQIHLSIATKEVGGKEEKAKLRSFKGSLQNKLSQNYFQSMSFLFFIIFVWYDINDINVFQYAFPLQQKR